MHTSVAAKQSKTYIGMERDLGNTEWNKNNDRKLGPIGLCFGLTLVVVA